MFDHGLSFLCSCYSLEEIDKFDILEDKPCQNFIGSRSTYDNLVYVDNKKEIFQNGLTKNHKDILLADLDKVLPKPHLDKIWNMLWARWCEYEKLCNI